jgi:hypothetical protein
MRSFEFWFDFGSTASYLAWTQLPALEAATAAKVVLKPMLLGGVFQRRCSRLGTPRVQREKPENQPPSLCLSVLEIGMVRPLRRFAADQPAILGHMPDRFFWSA